MELCEKKVSKVGFGTWKIGGGYWSADRTRDSHWLDLLKYVVEKGINLFDTAEMYGDGHAEELLGQALKGEDQDEFTVITKVWNNHLKYDDVIKAARASLRRLGLKYIDIYLIHWPSPSVPLRETMRAMEKLVDDGVVRCIGVSNFDTNLLEEVLSAVNRYKIEVNEMEYSILNRKIEKDLITLAQRNGVKIVAYSPLGRGEVSSLPILTEVAKKYGRTPVQVALNYVARKAIPIPKASTKPHVDDIAGTLDWDLTDEDYRYLASLPIG
ncbi:MAG: aldo/keto reductase [Metallosphaera yellowstonensis]|jgi:Aldo/keto reductases, related to diketogulonate reductase|uniref:Aldo/keto reductase, diketogulonate reductase n=1 Tax=Metallosphaera yellowstonensis MK1 TaxID=671065 RepID=H2C4X9_9CREN|nr:aldo/keto reductase [Metallosphaera yellowstonensis]EHP71070.1 aldo/keto reductase, diketogulonate reductase [Metallosphaera yellowstonensis MK1]